MENNIDVDTQESIPAPIKPKPIDDQNSNGKTINTNNFPDLIPVDPA